MQQGAGHPHSAAAATSGGQEPAPAAARGLAEPAGAQHAAAGAAGGCGAGVSPLPGDCPARARQRPPQRGLLPQLPGGDSQGAGQVGGACRVQGAAVLLGRACVLWCFYHQLPPAATAFLHVLCCATLVGVTSSQGIPGCTSTSTPATCHRCCRLDEAESACREGLSIRRRAFGEDHLAVALSLQSLAVVLRAQQRWQEAAEVLAACVATREKLLSTDSPQLASAYHQQVRACTCAGGLQCLAQVPACLSCCCWQRGADALALGLSIDSLSSL